MGKMTAVATTEAFLKGLEESGVLPPKSLVRAKELASAAPDLKTAARALIKEGLLTLWQAKQLAAGCNSLRFGRYKLLDELGHSEMGRVYLAEHGQLNRRVALKILSRRLTADGDAVQRFLAEARVLSSLDHRNLIHVFDVGQEGDRFYLVLEYVTGKSFDALLKADGPPGVDTASRWVRQAAAGLAAAHAQGVAHGDLKPGNLLVDENGAVKLLDLGVAQLGHSRPPGAAAGAAANVSAGGSAPGDDAAAAGDAEEATGLIDAASLPYLAPGQADGERASPQADLYSLGAIWHLLLTGAPPACPAIGTDVAAQARATLESAGSGAQAIPPPVVDMVAQLLAADPAARGGSAAAFGERLDAWLATRPAPKPPADKRPVPAAEDSTSGSSLEPLAGAASATSAKPPPKRSLPRAKSLDAAAPALAAPTGAAEPAEPETTGDSGAPAFSIDTSGGGAADAGAPAPFVIRTKGKSTGKSGGKGAAKKKGGKATGEPGGDAPGMSPKKKLLLIVGGAAAAGLVLLVGVVLLVVSMFFQGAEEVAKEIAKADRDAADAEQAAETEGTDEPGGESGDAAAKADPATDEPMEPGAGGPAPPKPDAPKPEEPKPEAPKPEEPKPAPEAPKPEAPKPEVKPEPAKPEPPKPEAPKPEPAKPEPPKPPAADPFKDLPQVVDLPAPAADPAANQVVKLGAVQVDPKALCVVHLLGGSGAIKGQQKFAIDAADNGTAPRDWEIRILDAAAETGGKKIAHLAIKDDSLNFQWTPEAASEPAAPSLVNCVVRLAAGTKSAAMGLRRPIVGEPVKLDIFKGGTGKWDIPNSPDPDKMQIEFALEGPFPNHKLEGAQPTPVEKGTVTFTFQMGERPEDFQVLALKVDSSMRKNLQATAAVWFKPSFSPKPEKLTPTSLKKAITAQTIGQQQLFGAVDFMRKQNKQDELSKTRLAQAEEQQNAAQRGLQQLEQVRTLVESLGEGAKLHVRVYFLADDKKIELLSTGGPVAAPAAKP